MRAVSVIVTFLVIAALVGFTFGTIVLIGPVRWIAAVFRSRGGMQLWEDAAVVSVITIVFAMVIILALFLTQMIATTTSRKVRFGVPLAILAAGIAANFYWQQSTLRSMERSEERLARFTFGPYPDEQRMRRLREEGYTAVISLLHPAVIPIEPPLILRERKAAARAGISMIELPMLPWVSRNARALSRLRELALQKDGRYYVHCHLGVDRLLLAKRVVAAIAPNVAAVPVAKDGISAVKRLERGEVVRLDASTFVTPFPTREEFVAHVLSDPAISVFCILDPHAAEDAARIAEERRILDPYKIPVDITPLSLENYDPALLMKLVERVKSTPGRRLVHSFLGAETGKSPVVSAFISAYATKRAPLLPSLDGVVLRDGSVKIVVPDVATGPQPFGGESLTLQRHGVRKLICIDGPVAPCRPDDVYQPPGLDLSIASDEREAASFMAGTSGPFYVYEVGRTLDLPMLERMRTETGAR